LPVRWEHIALGTVAIGIGVLAGIDPVLALAATLGLAFVLVALADVTVGLCIFALLAFVDQLPQVGDSSLTLTKFVGLLLAASWFATVATAGRARTFVSAHPGMTYVLAFFLGWVCLSLAWSEDPTGGAESLVRYALNVVLLLIVFTAVSDRRRATWVVGAFVLAATASAAHGIVSPPAADQSEGVARVSGTIGDPNEFAALLVAGLVLAVALIGVARRAPVLRTASVLAAVLCTAGIFVSVSRGGLVALAVALLAALFLAGRWRPVVLFATVLVAISGAVYFSASGASDRLTLEDRGTGRLDIWTVGWRMVQDKPVTGVGAGNFQQSAIHYLLEPGSILRDEFIVVSPLAAHNVYLQVTAELGVVGLLLFLAILGFSLSCAMRAATRFRQAEDVRMELLSRGVLLALIGLLAADFFLSDQYSKQLWLLLGLAPALLYLAPTSSGPAPPVWRSNRTESPAPAGSL